MLDVCNARTAWPSTDDLANLPPLEENQETKDSSKVSPKRKRRWCFFSCLRRSSSTNSIQTIASSSLYVQQELNFLSHQMFGRTLPAAAIIFNNNDPNEDVLKIKWMMREVNFPVIDTIVLDIFLVLSNLNKQVTCSGLEDQKGVAYRIALDPPTLIAYYGPTIILGNELSDHRGPTVINFWKTIAGTRFQHKIKSESQARNREPISLPKHGEFQKYILSLEPILRIENRTYRTRT